jgi:hypothetical protein
MMNPTADLLMQLNQILQQQMIPQFDDSDLPPLPRSNNSRSSRSNSSARSTPQLDVPEYAGVRSRKSPSPVPMPSESELVRQEQDEQYERSLEADRRKAQQEEEERKKREAEEKQQKDEELFSQLTSALTVFNAEEAEKRKLEQRQQLPPEPNERESGVTQIQLRMPDGSKVTRRFRNSDKLQLVYDFAVTEPNLDTSVTYALATPFPSKVFTDSDMQQTLEQLKMSPRTMLVLQKQR